MLHFIWRVVELNASLLSNYKNYNVVVILRDGNDRQQHLKIWQHSNSVSFVVMHMVISFKMF